MNARALLLLLAVLVTGGGLAYFLTSQGPRTTTGDGPLVSGLEPTSRPSLPADEPSGRPLERTQLMGLSSAWTILVVGARGEPLSEARIIVRSGDSSESAKSVKGRATFTGLEAGTWLLAVSADGLPTWEGEVTLDGSGNAPVTTVVKLTNQIRVAGNVIDERGEPVGGVTLWLLPELGSHPTDASLSKGLIQATSTTDGRFQLDTEQPGRWKVTVGRAGQKPRFESAPFELVQGRERIATVVVPARARLVIDVPLDDYKGPNVVAVLGQREGPLAPVETIKAPDSDNTMTEGGRQLSAADAEAIRRKQGAAVNGSAKGEDESLAKAQSIEQLTAEQRQQMEEQEQRQERDRQRRARLIEDGWANLRSARFDSGSLGQVDELPEGKPLRFVLYRGVEGFQVTETLVAPSGSSVRLTLTPPAPFPPGAELPDFPRIAPSRIEITPLGPSALPLGLTFKN